MRTLKTIFSGFFLAVLAGSSLTASAAVFYRDDRFAAQPRPGDPLARIGTLTRLSDASRGTAFLIGRCHVLTNFHVAFSSSVANPQEISVFQIPSEDPVRAIPVTAGALTEKSPSATEEDWAVLKLDSCLGDKYGWFEFEKIPTWTVTREKLVMAGFPSDKSTSSLTVDPDCAIHPETFDNPAIWRHDCASRPGSSGSPLLLKRGDDYRVVALNETERSPYLEIISSFSAFLANGAIPAELFHSKIQNLIGK